MTDHYYNSCFFCGHLVFHDDWCASRDAPNLRNCKTEEEEAEIIAKWEAQKAYERQASQNSN